MDSTGQVFDDCRKGPLSHCRKVVFVVLSLAIILLAVYGNSFDCSWHFDDEPNITDNPNLHMTELSWEQIGRALKSDRNSPHSLYRPVACLSFALNHYFDGLNVFGYHLVNLTIHFLSSIFLFIFVFNTLQLPSLRERYSSNAYSIALLSTVLWAVNPIQTQAVTYIVQRMASLAAMFYILSMYFYLKARTAPKVGSRAAFFFCCGLSFLLALGSKENAAMLPMSLFLYEATLIQENTTAFFRKNIKWFILTCSIILFIGVLYFYSKQGTIFSFLKGYERRPFSLAERLLTQPRIIILYVSLLLYPLTSRLNLAHSFELSRSLFDPISTFFAVLAIFLLVAFAFYLARKRPLFSFCILFFFLNHVIESSVFPLEIAYEHRNYIPSMLFFLPFAIGLLELLERYETKKIMKFAVAAFICLLVMGFGHAAHLRNLDWKTPQTLWTDTVGKSPDTMRAYHNLGRYYQNRGQLRRALQIYQQALTKTATNRKDESFITHYNIGKAWADLNDYGEAESHFRQAINLNPSYSPAYNNLAAAYECQGKKDLAYENLLKAFRIDPYAPFLNYNLGLHYLKEGRSADAIQHLRRALHSVEYKSSATLCLAIAHKQEGRLGQASVLFREALRKNPQDTGIHLHLAELYQKAGHPTLALKEAERALDLAITKGTFHKILEDLPATDRTRNVKPDGEVVIPLLSRVVKRKKAVLDEWDELLHRKANEHS
ncbi:MAG: tetratricopeptide repeat protein [Deltaproteobacteria bacterium]|nr:tetratricopeptide repeat protein [Deltaproteobacteria bacterium]